MNGPIKVRLFIWRKKLLSFKNIFEEIIITGNISTVYG